MRTTSELEVEGEKIPVSNLEKVLYPKARFTKGQVIDYYIRISSVLLPHLKKHPLTLKRYPNGVEGEFFYEKQCPRFRPKWVEVAPVKSDSQDKTINYCLANDLRSLVWAANLADLELHTSLSMYPKIDQPRSIVFDLDPGAPANVVDCAQVALWVREKFDQHGLQTFIKTSGSKGLQLYAPLNTPVNYDQTKTFAKNLAEEIEREHPDRVVAKMAKALRGGKVFIDWSQNDRHKTTVSVYSLRARERPTVSTPLEWPEVSSVLRSKDAARLVFEAQDAVERVKKKGDLFAPLLTLKQKLPGP